MVTDNFLKFLSPENKNKFSPIIQNLESFGQIKFNYLLLSSLVYFIRLCIVVLYVFCLINGTDIQITGSVVDGNTGYSIDNVNISSKGLNSDIHASAEYRAHIIKVMTKKAISSC